MEAPETLYLIKINDYYFIVRSVGPEDIIVCSSPDLSIIEAARKIAEKTGATKLEI